MNKIQTLLTVFTLLCTLCVYADDKIAVVDLGKIVSHSPQVKALKQEHSKQMIELEKIIVNARGEIANEKSQEKALLLEDKYMKEFNSKKAELDKSYNAKLAGIEKNIKTEIAKKAEKDGYKYIFAQSVVLYGGDDITDDLIKNIK